MIKLMEKNYLRPMDYRTEKPVIGAGTIATLLACSNYAGPFTETWAGMAAPFDGSR